MEDLKKQFDKEKNPDLRSKMVKENPSLATQDNYDNEKDWQVRYTMLKSNHLLATQENYEKEGNEFSFLRDFISSINKGIK